MKDKIFYRFIIKCFQEQLHNYFYARIPADRFGVGDVLPINKTTYIQSTGWTLKIDKNGKIRSKTTDKHYNKGWNDCIKEMQSRII